MNGPNFLFFYVVVGALTILAVMSYIKRRESQWPIPKLNLIDPYEIALLRGGKNEVLRIAILSLIDRGLLTVSGETLRTKTIGAIENARRYVEKAILKKCTTPTSVQDLYKSDDLKAACVNYRSSLMQHRLLADSTVYALRRPAYGVGIFVLASLAGAKLIVALSRRHYNVTFLISIALGFLIYLSTVYLRERTHLGDRVLADLKTLFAGLKSRASLVKSGGATNEMALLAAVFGISALTAANFPYIKKLFPNASALHNSNSGSSCSSSDSSCGGGGGCGGCGGD